MKSAPKIEYSWQSHSLVAVDAAKCPKVDIKYNCHLPTLSPSRPPLSDSLKPDPLLKPSHPTSIQPPLQILTLTHIKLLQLMAALDNSLDSNPCDAHAAAHGQRAQFQQVQTDAAEGGVGDGGATEREIKFA